MINGNVKPAEKFVVPIGPQHPALKEPGHFELTIDGETVTEFAKGMNAPMKTIIAKGMASGTCMMSSAAPMATVSTKATIAVPRT